eukprot:bmy_10827T0
MSYAFLMPICRKAHKKQPSSVNFTEFFQKCLVKNTVSAKERGKLEDIAKGKEKSLRISIHRKASFNLVSCCISARNQRRAPCKCCRGIGRMSSNADVGLAYSGTPLTEEKEKIVWVRFENADLNVLIIISTIGGLEPIEF